MHPRVIPAPLPVAPAIAATPTRQSDPEAAEPMGDAAAGSGRIWLLDTLRVVAMFEIVSWHAAGYRVLGLGIGLPLFLLILTSLAAREPSREPLGAYARRRATRLLIPWVFWSAVYGVAGVAAAVAEGTSVAAEFELPMLLYGPETHLWYLPFAWAAGIAVRFLSKVLDRRGPLGAVAVGTGLGILCIASSMEFVRQFHPGRPFLQWWFALPSIPLGLAIGRAARETAMARRLVSMTIVAAALTAMWAMSSEFEGAAQMPIRYAVVGSLVGLAFALPRTRRAPLRRVGELTLGIYLVHPMLLSVLRRIPGSVGWNMDAVSLTVMLASALVVLMLRRTFVRRFV